MTMNDKYYKLSVNQLERQFQTSLENGLSSEQAKKRLEEHGANVLVSEEKVTPLQMFLLQFKDFLVYLLLAAVVASLAFGDFIEAFIIVIIVILNAVLGFVQEYRAEKSLEKLKELTADDTLVIRDGREMRVETHELVPGDILMLYEGETIAADVRLFETSRLKIEEGMLTGESVPVDKTTEPFTEDYVPLAEQNNQAFMGTTTVKGRGKGIVVRTGMDTEMGMIASSTLETEEQLTPLQKTLDQLGKILGIIVIFVVLLVLGTQLLEGVADFKEAIETAIALAVSAVPEGLAAAVTLTLALGVQRMVKRNAVIRKLPAVETLGSVEVICTDKTGTLTQNKMTVIKVWTPTLGEIDISGTGYNPKGNFTRMEQDPGFFYKKLKELAQDDPQLQTYLEHIRDLGYDTKISIREHWELYETLKSGALCNTASINFDGKANEWDCIGDPTEGSLVVAAMKANLNSYWEESYELEPKGELFFDSVRKRMTMIYTRKKMPEVEEWEYMKNTNDTWAYLKGSPKSVLSVCSKILLGDEVVQLTDKMREEILKKNKEFANKAYRVLAFAHRNIPDDIPYTEEDIEQDMTFLGLQCMIDPPRDEIDQAIRKAKDAGIRIIMITGDQMDTALAIAQNLDLKPDIDAKYTVATSRELEQMGDDEFKEIIKDLDVCARASPSIKQRIVTVLQDDYEQVVAMTGDGVNDAPALKKADIGVAMGITGTDVSREASDMVLMDDNFATIVHAVEEGRVINSNMKKFIRYMLSSNFDEILVVFVATVILGLPSPYLALGILWINLLTDGLPSLALSVDPGDPNIMKKKPLGRNKRFINQILMFSVAAGIISFLATMIFFLSFDLNPQAINYQSNLVTARTMALTVSVLFELFQVLVSKSREDKFFISMTLFNNIWLWLAIGVAFISHLMIMYIEPLAEIFSLTGLSIIQWIEMLTVVIVGILLLDIIKIAIAKFYRAKRI